MTSKTLERRQAGPVEIAYRVTGEGTPLIMFHGAEGDHQIYDRLQDALGLSVTAISFDQRDCGHTRFPDPQPYQLKDVAEDAVRLMDALGHEKAHVMGNSIGGILAQLMAFYWPTRVDRLVLGLTWPADERLQDLNPEGLAKRAEYGAMGAEGQRLMVEFMAGPDYVAKHPEILEDLQSLAVDTPPEARARRQAAFAAPHAIDPAAIRHQTLVIGGGADRMAPPDVTRRIAARIPGARFEILPGAGHLAARQYPQELAAMIRTFLNG